MKFQLPDFTGSGSSAPSIRKNPILEATKISRLPAFRPSVSVSVCVNCKKTLGHESEFSQRVKVCRKCLIVYSVIDAALNLAADSKAQSATRERFTQKLLNLGK